MANQPASRGYQQEGETAEKMLRFVNRERAYLQLGNAFDRLFVREWMAVELHVPFIGEEAADVSDGGKRSWCQSIHVVHRRCGKEVRIDCRDRS